jgi:hypothetical protein
MAKAAAERRDPDVEHAEEVDAAWSPSKLTGLGIVTLGIAIAIIVFMATRLTTCMYLDGSQP